MVHDFSQDLRAFSAAEPGHSIAGQWSGWTSTARRPTLSYPVLTLARINQSLIVAVEELPDDAS
jgi:hypothetical protein